MPENDPIKALMDKAVEAPTDADQAQLEQTVLATLAIHINSDLADLKYNLLCLQPDDFYFEDYRAIYAAMKTLADDLEYVDQTTVGQKTNDKYKDTLLIVFDQKNAAEDPKAALTYKKRIIHRSSIRNARTIGQEYLKAVEGLSDDPDRLPQLVGDLMKAVGDLEQTRRILPPIQSEADLLDTFLMGLHVRTPGYSTGFKRLDDLINGLPTGLFILSGTPSAGKTTYIKQLADQVAEHNKTPVLFFSYEQSADELRIKSLSRLSGIDNETIKTGQADEKYMDDIRKDYNAFSRYEKIIEADRRHTIGVIRMMAQREKIQSGKAPVVIIDYLQIMPPSDSDYMDRRSQVDLLVSDLRRLARDLDAPVLVISSMSRSEYDQKHGRLTAFKESGGIEYGADIAAVMTVEKEDPAGKSRDVTLAIVKNRHGRRAKITMKYNMTIDAFVEQESEPVDYLVALGKDNYQDE